MNDLYLLSALALGFLGSLHCIGMCGPIAMALPAGGGKPGHGMASRLAYNSGRIITYVLLGFMVGLIGFGLAWRGFQGELSLLTGILIILGVLFGRRAGLLLKSLKLIGSITTKWKRKFTLLFGRGTLMASFLIGILNGILPCGFVYIALAGAAGTGHFASSAMYMALFGLGTVPAMLAVGISGQWLGRRFSGAFRKASPAIAIAIALMLIYRGDVQSKKTCHHESAIPRVEALK